MKRLLKQRILLWIGLFVWTVFVNGCHTGRGNSSVTLTVSSVKAITKRQILPDFKQPTQMSRVLALRTCLDEYQPASFVVWTQRERVTIEARATDLKNGKAVIGAEEVDIRTIKRWYQAGDQIGDGAPTNQMNDSGLKYLSADLWRRKINASKK